MNLMTSSHASTPSDLSGAHSPAALARSLIGDVRSLGLVGQKTSALTDFAEQVVTQVQALNDAVVIEEYSGAEFLPLISRLNQEVAPHLLAPAATLAAPGRMHICLIHQADQLSTEQQAILFRLIELFPALPFRMVWLSRQPLHAWTSHAAMTSVIVDLDAQAASRQGRGPATPTAPASHTDTLSWPAANAGTHPMKAILALVGVAVLGAWAWLSATTSGPAAPATDKPSATASAPAPAALPASATAPVMAPERPAQDRAEPSSAAPASPGKRLPDMAQTNAEWLLSLPADSLVVEHGTFSTLEQVQGFQAKHKDLVTARILAVRKTPNAQDWHFSLVTGHFRSEDRAKRYVARLEWRTSARIRATDKFKPLVVSAP